MESGDYEIPYAARMKDDYRSGERSGVESTSTLYMNGVRYDGPNEAEPMLQAMEEGSISSVG